MTTANHTGAVREQIAQVARAFQTGASRAGASMSHEYAVDAARRFLGQLLRLRVGGAGVDPALIDELAAECAQRQLND